MPYDELHVYFIQQDVWLRREVMGDAPLYPKLKMTVPLAKYYGSRFWSQGPAPAELVAVFEPKWGHVKSIKYSPRTYLATAGRLREGPSMVTVVLDTQVKPKAFFTEEEFKTIQIGDQGLIPQWNIAPANVASVTIAVNSAPLPVNENKTTSKTEIAKRVFQKGRDFYKVASALSASPPP